MHFILCVGALASSLNHVNVEGKITGMQYSCDSPLVSHLNFADDKFLFCKGEPHKCDEVMKVFQTNGKASEQCINFDKPSLLFGT